jgi:caa(3)-type oxidase subunit IV
MSENTHTEEHDDHDDHAAHHIVSWKLYLINAAVITVLMFLTVFAAEFDFGSTNGLNLVIALLIAIMKTACIGAIFMGVWWNSPLVKIFATGVIAWLIIMFSFILVDYASPGWGLGSPYADGDHQGQSSLPGGADAVVIPEVIETSGDHGAPAAH